MKKDYEEYRDTGVLGGYHPEMAVLREQSDGEVMTIFRDTSRSRIWSAGGRCSSVERCFM